jgi:hypothetical protein
MRIIVNVVMSSETWVPVLSLANDMPVRHHIEPEEAFPME